MWHSTLALFNTNTWGCMENVKAVNQPLINHGPITNHSSSREKQVMMGPGEDVQGEERKERDGLGRQRAQEVIPPTNVVKFGTDIVVFRHMTLTHHITG